ncbi:MAG: hypothetical protein U1E62_08550 [Alsobacter sp.]
MARQKRTGKPAPRRPAQDKAEAGSPEPSGMARAEREMVRQAECAAMLIALTRMLLNLRGRDFAVWLRSIADDFEATDPEPEDVEDLAEELIRMGSTGTGADDAEDDEDGPPRPPEGRRRPH